MKREDIRILLIDDEEMIVHQLSDYLENCDYNIDGKCDPEEALQLIKDNHYDMVITDLRMPKVSGMEIVKSIKKTKEDTVTLIITGYADTESAIEAIQHGVYDFIRKPFEFKELKSKIDRAADKIIMKHKNQKLNNKIKMMLNYITTIFDISSILYQVLDSETIIHMILDTITEGLKIQKVGILFNQQYKETYTISKSRNLPPKLAKNLEIGPKSKINDIALNENEPTIIDSIENHLTIDGQEFEIEDKVSRCLLMPISFRDSIFGYLLVFDVNTQPLSTEDELKLLKILATQIVPLFLSQNLTEKKDQQNIKSTEYIIKNIIENSIKKAQKRNNTIHYLQMKVIFTSEVIFPENYEQFQDKIVELIQQEVPPSAEILRQGYGSFFLVLYESSPVEAEHICANIRTEIEELYSSEDNEPNLSLKYAMVQYPHDGENFLQIMNNIESKMHNNSTDIYLNDHKIMK
ncbi:MAG: response regulator [Candidatus Marinimicrobia bacterium]|nr:response regulator [Candidatus Neomarinimicrobiota bacterium]